MPLEHTVLAAKYSIGVVAMPMSITSMPAATRPRIRLPARPGPLSRPSRPTATAVSPWDRAMVPNALPMPSAISSVTVWGTMPRMS